MSDRESRRPPFNDNRARRANPAGDGHALYFAPLSKSKHGRFRLFRRHLHERNDNLDLLIWIGG